jgi:pyruvate kinase
MSHADHAMMKRLVGIIREIETEMGRPIGILVDLQGPKLRIGRFEHGEVRVERGGTFRLDLNAAKGNGSRVELPHPDILRVIEPGHSVLLDDGRVRLKVTETGPDYAETEVLVGGTLKDRKGFNVPDALLPMSAMSEKDRADMAAALDLGADWIALSFVQKADDVAEARKLAAGRAAVMAKIERPQAVDNLDDILALADGIMVARGDLGVELPVEQVPGLQKRINRAARRAGKPVVVATQMLESMVTSPMPTRAEVSDVSTAVFEGADAIMLSAESAAGRYPSESVAMMDRIAETVEADANFRGIIEAQRAEAEPTTADAIMSAARDVSQTVTIACIVCWTSSGSTGLRMARERPSAPIVALTPIRETARRMAMSWGLHCVTTEDARDIDDMVERACRITVEEGFAKPGDRIVVTAGLPFGTPGSTNLLRVAFVG